MKTCRRCGHEKPHSDFTKDRVRSDGHSVYCRACTHVMHRERYARVHGTTHEFKRLRTWSAPDRFEAQHIKIPGSGYWIWLGAPTGSFGYGRITVDGRNMPAHRYSYKLHVAPIPEGMLVLHRCDVPLCVNPSHLFLGTCQDNSDDCWRKGRGGCGPKHGQATSEGMRRASA